MRKSKEKTNQSSTVVNAALTPKCSMWCFSLVCQAALWAEVQQSGLRSAGRRKVVSERGPAEGEAGEGAAQSGHSYPGTILTNQPALAKTCRPSRKATIQGLESSDGRALIRW